MVTYCPYCMSPASSGQLCSNCGADPSSYHPSSHHFPMGQLLHDRYLVGKVLGEGGFGITYLGLDTKLERRVAIKEYFPNVFVHRESSVSLDVTCYTGETQTLYEKGRDQFLQEAQILAQLDAYPEIVHVHDFFPDNNTAYIVMELLVGNTLHTVLAQQKRIPVKRLFEIMEPVLQTMNAMHRAGIIHRDISPDNFMLLDNGQLKLLDFGCARDVDKEHTMTVMLKHGYAPMEQYTGYNQGPWTDIYALCATLYHCLTGEMPPKALERLSAQDDPLIPPNRLGAALTPKREQALIRGLAVDPKDRWQSIAGLYAELYGTVIPEPLPGQSNGTKPEPPAGPPTEPADPLTGLEPGPESDSGLESTSGPGSEPAPKKKSALNSLAQKKKLLVGIAAALLVFVVILAYWGRSNASSVGLPPSPTVSEQDSEEPQSTEQPQDTVRPQNTEEPQDTELPQDTQGPQDTEEPEDTKEPQPSPTLTPTSAPTSTPAPTPTPTPTPATGSITLSPSTLTLTQGDSGTITATASPSGQAVTWNSSNTSVATVSNGRVTAVGRGSATITASFTYGGKTYSESCTVSVTEVSISLSQSNLSLISGESQNLTASTTPSGHSVTWSSSNTNVATVSGGRVTAVSGGSATITAEINYNGRSYTATCRVTVTAPSISLSKTSLSMTVGDSETLTATVSPSGRSVTWSSSNTSVATVSGGRVTAVGGGSATITAEINYSGRSYTATCRVTVTAPSISLSKTSLSMTVGDSETLTATVSPSGRSVTWSSSNTSVATVSNGKVMAVGSGSATITAEIYYNGRSYTATCQVTVSSRGTYGYSIFLDKSTYVKDEKFNIYVQLDTSASYVNKVQLVCTNENGEVFTFYFYPELDANVFMNTSCYLTGGWTAYAIITYSDGTVYSGSNSKDCAKWTVTEEKPTTEPVNTSPPSGYSLYTVYGSGDVTLRGIGGSICSVGVNPNEKNYTNITIYCVQPNGTTKTYDMGMYNTGTFSFDTVGTYIFYAKITNEFGSYLGSSTKDCLRITITES